MLAKGNEEFAYRVVDPAEVPKLRDWPRRSLIVVIATMLGGILGLLIVLVRHAFASRGDTEKTG
jgi:LPS O-antigen subunit length determinant protein (WzzB/FepE family)